MSASLVGSEMCIRDRGSAPRTTPRSASGAPASLFRRHRIQRATCRRTPRTCLLYTSDAADDM
eukprot:15225035-Alexandrium_andersonii.AAC.1